LLPPRVNDFRPSKATSALREKAALKCKHIPASWLLTDPSSSSLIHTHKRSDPIKVVQEYSLGTGREQCLQQELEGLSVCRQRPIASGRSFLILMVMPSNSGLNVLASGVQSHTHPLSLPLPGHPCVLRPRRECKTSVKLWHDEIVLLFWLPFLGGKARLPLPFSKLRSGRFFSSSISFSPPLSCLDGYWSLDHKKENWPGGRCLLPCLFSSW
jgi:hypothetical protein